MERRRSRRSAARKTFGARVKDFLRQFVAFMFSNVGIIGLVVGYTIFGALVFKEIEGKNSKPRIESLTMRQIKLREATANQLWDLTCCQTSTFSEHHWRNAVATVMTSYQHTLVHSIRNEGFEGENSPDKWSFAGAFLYSLTVITTIGYGNVTPHTDIGKMMTVLYAIVGMPLFLLYLSNIGDILAKSFKWVYAKLCLCRVCPAVRQRRAARAARAADDSLGAPAAPPGPVSPGPAPEPKVNSWQRDIEMGYAKPRHRDTYPGHRGSPEQAEEEEEEESEDSDSSSDSSNDSSEEEAPSWMAEEEEEEEEYEEEESSQESSEDSYDPQTVTVPLTLCILIMVGYVSSGAFLFNEWERWELLDGSYFCFISLSTIGFGDIVPGDVIDDGGIELSFIFCAMYLMLGMALIAMCFNLMQEEVISKLRACVRGVRFVTRCNKKAPPR